MHKLIVSALASTSLLAIPAGTALADSADIGIDQNQLLFRWFAPGADTGYFQVGPNGTHNVIVLPCDVEKVWGMFTIDYPGAGPTVFSKLTFTLFNAQSNAPISSTGCQGDRLMTSVSGRFGPVEPGTTASYGYGLLDRVGEWCDYLFQPKDLPLDTLVRGHIELSGYRDDTYDATPNNAVTDPNPSNNSSDLYFLRHCSCQ